MREDRGARTEPTGCWAIRTRARCPAGTVSTSIIRMHGLGCLGWMRGLGVARDSGRGDKPGNRQMRTCVVHIGTHKTGTTSLQMASSRHSADLQRHNYLYPRTGRPPGAADGHHHIARELSGDRRFRPEYGAAADLLAEVRDSYQDVILSSEDFECSVLDPCGFEAFVRLLRANHFAIRVIVYLRNQVDYAQSLYQTMLPFGVPDSFGAFLGKILEDGRFCWQEWVFLAR
jgi:hypothetical protein